MADEGKRRWCPDCAEYLLEEEFCDDDGNTGQTICYSCSLDRDTAERLKNYAGEEIEQYRKYLEARAEKLRARSAANNQRRKQGPDAPRKSLAKRHMITFNGETHTLTEWARKLGMKSITLSARINTYGWSIEKALTTPVDPNWRNPPVHARRKQANARTVTYNGETLTCEEWSRRLGMDRRRLNDRIFRRGWSLERAMTTPPRHQRREITYNGETLTLMEWSKKLGVDYSTLQHRLNRGVPVEEAFETLPFDKHSHIVLWRPNNEKPITFNGETHHLRKWSEKLGINYYTLYDRLKKGTPVEEAFTTPPHDKRRMITYNGETLPLLQWSKKLGIHYETLRGRLASGYSIEKAFTTPVDSKKAS